MFFSHRLDRLPIGAPLNFAACLIDPPLTSHCAGAPQSQGLGFGGPTPSRSMAARPRAQLPRPAFGSSPNLQALVLEAGEREASQPQREPGPAEAFYEVTIASADQPKLLSRLSEALVRVPFVTRM